VRQPAPPGWFAAPAAQRVAEYDKQNPGRSERQTSEDLGISKTAVHKARETGGHHGPPDDAVIGRDGKQYPARQPGQIIELTPRHAALELLL
jgi:hypothetical protein